MKWASAVAEPPDAKTPEPPPQARLARRAHIPPIGPNMRHSGARTRVVRVGLGPRAHIRTIGPHMRPSAREAPLPEGVDMRTRPRGLGARIHRDGWDMRLWWAGMGVLGATEAAGSVFGPAPPVLGGSLPCQMTFTSGRPAIWSELNVVSRILPRAPDGMPPRPSFTHTSGDANP